MRYTARLDPWEGGEGYTATVPALPERIIRGRAVDQAPVRSREAIEGFVATMVVAGEPVPVEQPPPNALAVEAEAEAEAEMPALAGGLA